MDILTHVQYYFQIIANTLVKENVKEAKEVRTRPYCWFSEWNAGE